MPSASQPDPAPIPKKGDRHRVRQSANRACYDRASLNAVLDACLIGHVSFVHDDWPVSIPTAIARLDDFLYLHGSRSSRLYQVLAAGKPVAVSVCRVDALVKARSAFHCTMNYRSAVIFGRGEPVTGSAKETLLDRFTERLLPGSTGDFRPPLAKELKATELVRLPLTEASVKIRSGDPIDDDEDIDLPYWAGILPIVEVAGEPLAAANLPAGNRAPERMVQALSVQLGRG